MKNRSYIILLYLLLKSNVLFSQNCVDFPYSSVDFLDINSAWIKKNKIKGIIEKEYSVISPDEVSLVNSFWYNSSGFVEKKVNGLPYPESDLPDTLNFTSVMLYSYETIDSFLYQTEIVVRHFNENGRLEKQDTLPPVLSNAYNFHKKKHEMYGDVVAKEYLYDNEKKLLFITELDSFGRKIELQYNKNDLSQIILSFLNNFNDPYLDGYTVSYEYNSDGLISKSTNQTQDSSIHYFYDKKGALVRKEIFFGTMQLVYYTYSYIYL